MEDNKQQPEVGAAQPADASNAGAQPEAAAPEPGEGQEQPNQSASGTAASDEHNAELFQLQQSNASLQEKVLRLEAELQNLYRRQVQELAKAHKYSIESCLKQLLPVLDSLEQAMQPAGADPDTGKAWEQHLEGVELTYKLMLSSLEKFQLTQINPAGEKFDPNFHEAMTMVPSPDHQPGHVIEVVQKGYLLHDRLIRAAMVVVAAQSPAAG